MSRQILDPVDRADVEGQITRDIGEFLDDVNAVADNMSYTWDANKGVLIAEEYSERGNPIRFFEVRVVVSYVGDGSVESEANRVD